MIAAYELTAYGALLALVAVLVCWLERHKRE